MSTMRPITRNALIEFLMDEGLRKPRNILRRQSTIWLREQATVEGLPVCIACGLHVEMLLETGRCEPCELKVEDDDDE